MAIDSIITFDRLECSRERDDSGHSEPYIWPVLMRVDDHTLATPALLGSLHLADQNARIVIKEDMKRGEAAAIPASQRTFVFRFDDNLSVHTVLVVVALFEEDETPDRAVTQGYIAFRNELPKAVAARLFELASATGDEEALIIEQIGGIVGAAVKAAVSDNLTATEKLGVFLGTLDLDDQIGVAHKRFGELAGADGKPVNQDFTLRFVKRAKESPNPVTDLYQLRGRFETRPVVRDRCQAQADRVKAAQQAVEGIRQEIKELQKQLRGEPDSSGLHLPKGFLIKEIARIRSEELAPAEVALDAERRALAQCRATGPGNVGNTGSLVLA